MIYAIASLVVLLVYATGLAVERNRWRQLVDGVVACELQRQDDHTGAVFRAMFPLLIQARTVRTINVARHTTVMMVPPPDDPDDD